MIKGKIESDFEVRQKVLRDGKISKEQLSHQKRTGKEIAEAMTPNNPITTCELCGTPVRVVGTVTKSYEPVKAMLPWACPSCSNNPCRCECDRCGRHECVCNLHPSEPGPTDSYAQARDRAAEDYASGPLGFSGRESFDEKEAIAFSDGADFGSDYGRAECGEPASYFNHEFHERQINMLGHERQELREKCERLEAELSEWQDQCEETRNTMMTFGEECERLTKENAELRAAYDDRGAAMRETGDMVRSLYAPKNVKLNLEVGRLTKENARMQYEVEQSMRVDYWGEKFKDVEKERDEWKWEYENVCNFATDYEHANAALTDELKRQSAEKDAVIKERDTAIAGKLAMHTIAGDWQRMAERLAGVIKSPFLKEQLAALAEYEAFRKGGEE